MLKLFNTDSFSFCITQEYRTYIKDKNTACPEELSAYKQMETETECLII